MRTLGRIMMIVCAFALVMGLMYLAVNTGSSSAGTAAPTFERSRGFPPDGGRPELHGERGGGWMFGLIKNAGVIAVIVVLVTVPKSIRQRNIRSGSVSTG